jgi:hypothetical protein
MPIREIINKLSSIDLSSYPICEVQELIRELGKGVYLIFPLQYGKMLTRARLGCGYTQISELSYLPQDKNQKCQRASMPNRTMFYGTLEEGELLDKTRIIATSECSQLLRGGENTKGIEQITFGRWAVIKDINLIVILDDEIYNDVSENPLLTKLKVAYSNFLTTAPEPEIEENAKQISNFFAREFSKDNIQNDYDYFLSAVFTEVITNDHNYDGVMYPSVRSGGQWGFNVAIKPNIVDNNMILDKVLETTLYKNEKKTLLLEDRISALSTWKFVETQKLPENEICNHIGISDLSEIAKK